MKCFVKIVNSLTTFAKYSNLDVWQGFEYACDIDI